MTKKLLQQIKTMSYDEAKGLVVNNDGELQDRLEAFQDCYDFYTTYKDGKAIAVDKTSGKVINSFECTESVYRSWSLDAFEQEAEAKGYRFIEVVYIKDNIDDFEAELELDDDYNATIMGGAVIMQSRHIDI